MTINRLLRRKAASDYLRENHGLERAPSTLAKLAVIGGGPAFRRAGRVPFYAKTDLDDWVRSLLSAPMHSTSDVDFAASDMSERTIFLVQRGADDARRQAAPKPGDVT